MLSGKRQTVVDVAPFCCCRNESNLPTLRNPNAVLIFLVNAVIPGICGLIVQIRGGKTQGLEV